MCLIESCRAALFERREKIRYYSLDDILKGFDVGVLKLGEIALDIVIEVDLRQSR